MKVAARFYATSVAFYFLPSLSYYKMNTLAYQEENVYPRVGRKTKIYRLDFYFLTGHAQIDLAVIGEAKEHKVEKVEVEVEEQVQEYRAKCKVNRNWPPRNFWKRGQK